MRSYHPCLSIDTVIYRRVDVKLYWFTYNFFGERMGTCLFGNYRSWSELQNTVRYIVVKKADGLLLPPAGEEGWILWDPFSSGHTSWALGHIRAAAARAVLPALGTLG